MTQVKQYYANINSELLDICPPANRVLEFGCGTGRFLAAYKTKNSDAYCVGFEKFTAAAEEAQSTCDLVITGDAEQPDEHANLAENSFDLIIYGDVLEHFIDPWEALKKHIPLLKSGGTICACIPNISHWSMIFNLINGQFEYQDSGLMDRTHLRFFTKATIGKMFTEAGLTIELLQPRTFQTKNTQNALEQLAKIFNKPLDQISTNRIEDWSTFQYLLKATKQ